MKADSSSCLLSTYYVPGTVLRAQCGPAPSVPYNRGDYTHFTEKETEL